MVHIPALIIHMIHFHSVFFLAFIQKKIMITDLRCQAILRTRNIMRRCLAISLIHFQILILILWICCIIPTLILIICRELRICHGRLAAKIRFFHRVVIIIIQSLIYHPDITVFYCLTSCHDRKRISCDLFTHRIDLPIPVLSILKRDIFLHTCDRISRSNILFIFLLSISCQLLYLLQVTNQCIFIVRICLYRLSQINIWVCCASFCRLIFKSDQNDPFFFRLHSLSRIHLLVDFRKFKCFLLHRQVTLPGVWNICAF